MTDRLVSISIVSHMQIQLVRELLQDIQSLCATTVEVILTINMPEEEINPADYPFSLTVIRNKMPKGFGANHNAALRFANGDLFCILNPDIRLACDPFPSLISAMERFEAAIAAPVVVNASGEVEDSARRFPTPFSLMLKAIGRPGGQAYDLHGDVIYPDWVGGMFMLMPTELYRRLDGFDESYFLYYEDVDLCARAYLQGLTVILVPTVSVIHHARRSSHRSFRYLKWHLASISRFFLSRTFLAILLRRLTG